MTHINSAKVTLSFKTTLIYFKVPIIFLREWYNAVVKKTSVSLTSPGKNAVIPFK